jgi:hypothetical protein
MRRQNWVDSLVEESKHVETPESWLWWSSLACISSVAGNNYSLRTLKGDLIYKPNLYIMLLGESGLGKGYPINRAKLLVQKAGVTRVIAGRSSIQAIVQDLSRTKTVEGKAPIGDSRAFIVNGELSTAIIQDPDSLTILTDLYDGHYNPEWTNLLKGDGAEKLKNPYITALFGSSPAHFYDSIPQANIEGGYIGRNLIIYEEKRRQDVDLLDIENDEEEEQPDSDRFDTYLVPKYVPHLNAIAAKKGELKPSSEARKAFNLWRKKWRGSQTADKTGFLNRVPDHILKVAMCLSLAEWDFDGIISEFHIEEATQRVTQLVYSNKRTTEGRGPDPLAASTKIVLDYLIASPNNKLPRKTLLWKGYGTFNSFTLDQIVENLLELGWIRRTRTGSGKALDWEYELWGEPRESYAKYLKDKEVKR